MKLIAAPAAALALFLATAVQAQTKKSDDKARYLRLESLLATSFKVSGDEIWEAIQETVDELRRHHVKQSDLSVAEDAHLLHLDGRTGYEDFDFMLENYVVLRRKGYTRYKAVQLLNRRCDAAYALHGKVDHPPAQAEYTPQEKEQDRRLTSLLIARFKVNDDDIMWNVLNTLARLRDRDIQQSYMAILDDAAQLHSHSRTGFQALKLLMTDYTKERIAGHSRSDTVRILNQRYDAASEK